MNTEALQRGREAARAKRDAQAIRDVEAFKAWSRKDAQLYAAKREARAEHGYFTPEYTAATDAWHDHLHNMPTPPPDHAWRLARGEDTAA